MRKDTNEAHRSSDLQRKLNDAEKELAEMEGKLRQAQRKHKDREIEQVKLLESAKRQLQGRASYAINQE